MKHHAATPSPVKLRSGWPLWAGIAVLLGRSADLSGLFPASHCLTADTCPLDDRPTPHLPPEGFPVLSSSMNTGDAYLPHSYHRFANWKSGTERAASSGNSAVKVTTTRPKAMAIPTTPENMTRPIRNLLLLKVTDSATEISMLIFIRGHERATEHATCAAETPYSIHS